MKTKRFFRTFLQMVAVAAIITLTSGTTFGQAYDVGAKQINLGIGFAGGYAAAGSTSSTPALSGSFEYGVTDKISVGLLVGFYSASYGFLGTTTTVDYSYLTVGPRGSYHFAVSDNYDVYAGAMLAYNNVSVSASGTSSAFASSASSGIVLGLYIGGRYMFTDNIGAFAELGYSIALINVGLTAKF